MWGIALLVFREVLEAALIVTIVAAATRGVVRRGWFIGGGIGLGVLGAALVAALAGVIAEAVGGMGQEVFNAAILLAAVVMIGWHVLWMSTHARELSMHMKEVGNSVKAGSSSLAMLLAVVALAVLREGSEVVLFLYGMVAGGAHGLIPGLAIGIAGGTAVGFALYFGLLRIPVRHFFTATNWMLVLLASGLAASASRYLIQANMLPSLGGELWNTSWLLSNHSIVGQTLHILVGYDARPSGMMLLFYLVVLTILVVGMKLTGRGSRPPRAPHAQSQHMQADKATT
jgi:high-affinity iron transporter